MLFYRARGENVYQSNKTLAKIIFLRLFLLLLSFCCHGHWWFYFHSKCSTQLHVPPCIASSQQIVCQTQCLSALPFAEYLLSTWFNAQIFSPVSTIILCHFTRVPACTRTVTSYFYCHSKRLAKVVVLTKRPSSQRIACRIL